MDGLRCSTIVSFDLDSSAIEQIIYDYYLTDMEGNTLTLDEIKENNCRLDIKTEDGEVHDFKDFLFEVIENYTDLGDLSIDTSLGEIEG
jgi:hypothetical protein